MTRNVSDPVAVASMQWLTPEQGGRKELPAITGTYASTVSLARGRDLAQWREWDNDGDLSILIACRAVGDDNYWDCLVDFLDREQALPLLKRDDGFVLREGPRPVALGRWRKLFRT